MNTIKTLLHRAFISTFFILSSANLNAEILKLKEKFLQSTEEEISVKNNPNYLKINFDFESINHVKSDEGDFLILRNLPLTNEISGARVPFKAFVLKGRPHDFKVQIIKGESVALGQYDLSAYLPKPCRCNEVMKNNFEQDTYLASAPESFYKLEYLGDYRGTQLTRILIYPLRLAQNDKNNFDVEAYPSLQVNVTNQSGSTLLFEGGEAEPSHLVIVGPRALTLGVDEFANFKRQNGFTVTVKSYEDVGGTRDSLKAYFRSVKFTHAIILGHEQLIEPYGLITQFEQETPSDLPYFAMGGDEDTIADVFYSRISASTKEEVKSILQKSLEFEKVTKEDIKKSKVLVGIASNEGLNPSDKQYLEGMLNPLEEVLGMKAERFHQDNNSSPEGINQSLEGGTYWLNYIGHGSGFSWPSVASRPYEVTDIAHLKSTKVLPMLVDVACQNGRFEGNARLGEAFMLANQNGKSAGVRAYYGGTVNISWDPPAIMSQGISKFVANVFKNHLEKKTTVSDAMWAGQMFLLENYSEKTAAKENRIWYHLQGDPTMPLAGTSF